MSFPCQLTCPADADSVRKRTRSIGGEAASPVSFPPRRSAPRKLLAELLPPALAHHLVDDGTALIYEAALELRAVTESDGLLIKEIDGRWR